MVKQRSTFVEVAMLGLLLLLCTYWAAQGLNGGGERLHLFAMRYALLALLYLVAVWRLCTVVDTSKAATLLVWGVGLGARLMLTLQQPLRLSGDLYRYLWDGRLTLAGVSPYGIAPAAPSLASFQDWVHWGALFHKEIPTIYPPAAQALFALLAALAGDRLVVARLLLVGVELLAAFALWRMLQRDANSRSGLAIIIWLWHPLPLFEIAYSGHLDALVMLLAVGAWWAVRQRRDVLAGILLGLGGLTKLYPLVLAPALWRQRSLKMLVGVGATFLAGMLPLLIGATGGFWATLRWFLETGWFNAPVAGGLRSLLLRALPAPAAQTTTLLLLLALLFAVACWVAFGRTDQPNEALAGRALLMAGAWVIAGPALHPWYLLWLIPFLSLRPVLPLLLLTCTVGLSHAFYQPQSTSLYPWLMLLEFGLPALTLPFLKLRR